MNKICVQSYFCQSCEDKYETGCETRIDSCWDSSCHGSGGVANCAFDSVKEALEAVCRENCFKFVPENWEKFDEDYENATRFDSCFMVDEDNCEASPSEIEAWKRGEKRLWCCDVSVMLCRRTDSRLSDDECRLVA